MWASGRDLWEPTFISTCVASLVEHPEVVLAYARSVRIDKAGRRVCIARDGFDDRFDLEDARHSFGIAG